MLEQSVLQAKFQAAMQRLQKTELELVRARGEMLPIMQVLIAAVLKYGTDMALAFPTSELEQVEACPMDLAFKMDAGILYVQATPAQQPVQAEPLVKAVPANALPKLV